MRVRTTWLFCLLPVLAAAAPESPGSPEKTLFSSAFAGKKVRVASVERVPGGLLGVYTVTGAKEPQSAFVPTHRCGESECAGVPAGLGEGSRAVLVRAIDLRGPATSVEPSCRGGEGPSALEPLRSPALLFCVSERAKGRSEERFALVALDDGAARTVWSEGISLHAADGGGYGTIDRVWFERRQEEAPLEIALSQTSVPGRSDKPYRPGPPLSRRYVFTNGRYERTR